MTAVDKYKIDKDKNALIIAYLPLIKKIANKYTKISPVVDFDDLVNEAVCIISENLDKYAFSPYSIIKWGAHQGAQSQLKSMGFNLHMFRYIQKATVKSSTVVKYNNLHQMKSIDSENMQEVPSKDVIETSVIEDDLLNKIDKALSTLTEQERSIFIDRHQNEMTYEELSKKYQVSRQDLQKRYTETIYKKFNNAFRKLNGELYR